VIWRLDLPGAYGSFHSAPTLTEKVGVLVCTIERYLFLFFGLIVGIEGGRESSDGKTFGRNESSVISHKLAKAMSLVQKISKVQGRPEKFRTPTYLSTPEKRIPKRFRTQLSWRGGNSCCLSKYSRVMC
jgi:hypothetical protein